MRIALTHQHADGRADDWVAEAVGMPRKGIGLNSTEALGSLLRANLGAFGITEVATDELPPGPGEPRRAFLWQADQPD
jgi:hypothetical protein